MGVSPEESVVVCPVDPYVNDDYFEALKKLSEQADKGEANLVLMGIEPTYPSEKYGYITERRQEVEYRSDIGSDSKIPDNIYTFSFVDTKLVGYHNIG